MPHKPFISTSASRELFAFLDSALCGYPEPIALFGAPGTGKTAALQEFVRRQNQNQTRSRSRSWSRRRALYVRCEPGVGRVGVLQSILDRLTPRIEAQDGRHGLACAVRLLAAEELDVVVLDDAHHLYRPTLEMVGALFSRAWVSVILAGPELELCHRLEAVATFKHRVGRTRTLRALTETDVFAVLGELNRFRTSLDAKGKLARELHRHSRGNWDRLLRILDRCQEELERPRVPRLRLQHVRRALTDLGFFESGCSERRGGDAA